MFVHNRGLNSRRKLKIRLNLMSERDKSRVFARLIERKVEYWKKANERRESLFIYLLVDRSIDRWLFLEEFFFKYNRRTEKLRIVMVNQRGHVRGCVSPGCIMLSLNFDVATCQKRKYLYDQGSGFSRSLFDGSKSVIFSVEYNLKCIFL